MKCMADELRTERLLLRAWRPEDREPFAALNADPRVMEFFPSTLTKAESDAAAEQLRASIAQDGWGFWAVEAPRVSDFVGFVGIRPVPAHVPLPGQVEIGWRLAASHWGKGFASEAARASLRFGFESLGLPEIVSFTATPNLRSRAVMERLGMSHRGETFEHPRMPEGHWLRAHVVYRLSRSTSARKPSTASNVAG